MNRYIIYILAIVTMVGCQTERELSVGYGEDGSITFSSSELTTRTTEVEIDGDMVGSWVAGDKIGITSSGFTSEYQNIEYTALSSSATTYFDPVGEAINGSTASSGAVKFYAYYPYTTNYLDDTITVSVADQKDDLGAVDFMTAVSDELSNIASKAANVDLEFKHRLTKLVLNISFLSSIEELGELSTTLENIYTQAEYDLDGELISDSYAVADDIELQSLLDSQGRSATVTAILHPANYSEFATNIYFTVDGVKYTTIFREKLDANTIHSCNVTIGKDIVKFSEQSTITWDEVSSTESVEKEVWSGATADNFNGVVYDRNTTSYQITTGEELAYIAALVNGGDNLEGITFTMLNNIDLGNLTWSPIGNDSDSFYFNGTLDGGGFKIKRLFTENLDWGFGLFECIDASATIKNLNVEGNLTADGICGGIAGYNYGGTIDNCSFDGTITVLNYGSGYGGGIVGCNECGVVSNCYNKGTIQGVASASYITIDCIGGIAGTHRGAWYTGDEITGKIYACYNLGTISSNGDQIGGIAGLSAQGATIESCFNSGDVSGRYQVGGIVGLNGDSEVLSAYNMGEVRGEEHVGGIVGESKNFHTTGSDAASLFMEASCSYLYNAGNVIIDGAYASGVIGHNNRYADYCYAEKLFEGDEQSCGYYDSSSSSYIVACSTSDATAGAMEPLTHEEMINGTLLSNLTENSDFTSDVESKFNNGYPILKSINY